MNCPVCNVPLNLSERQGIEIDYCSQCRGIWLDRGELDKIIERSNTQINDVSREHDDPRFQERYADKDRYKNKKRKSFFDDLFDF